MVKGTGGRKGGEGKEELKGQQRVEMLLEKMDRGCTWKLDVFVEVLLEAASKKAGRMSSVC